MGMASFIEDEEEIKSEFNFLKSTFDELKSIIPHIDTISMGMSGDYKLAIDCGSTRLELEVVYLDKEIILFNCTLF